MHDPGGTACRWLDWASSSRGTLNSQFTLSFLWLHAMPECMLSSLNASCFRVARSPSQICMRQGVMLSGLRRITMLVVFPWLIVYSQAGVLGSMPHAVHSQFKRALSFVHRALMVLSVSIHNRRLRLAIDGNGQWGLCPTHPQWNWTNAGGCGGAFGGGWRWRNPASPLAVAPEALFRTLPFPCMPSTATRPSS